MLFTGVLCDLYYLLYLFVSIFSCVKHEGGLWEIINVCKELEILGYKKHGKSMKFKSTSMLFYLQLELSYFYHKNLESLEIQNYAIKCFKKTILSAKHILFLRTSSLWRKHSQKERMCFSPVSSMRFWRGIAARKGSSLQDCIWDPTKSELVAIIRALSSLRLTPAIEATSLMSSSSLQ